MGTRSKKLAERAHARRRAFERYGINVGRATREQIIAQIRSGQSVYVRRSSLRVTVHDVTLSDGFKVRVCYDTQRGEIVTFLP